MPPRTIDNLGNDASERYARDQHQIDAAYAKGASSIPSRTEIDVSSPFFPGELEILLHTQTTHVAWALFIPPKAYHEQRKRLFTSQITPSIGPEGKWEALAQKVLEKLHSLPDEKDGKEKKTITSLLTTIENLNKLIVEINCKKSQYQKG
jgi:hypothetical protein